MTDFIILRTDFLDNEDYVLRPITDDEVALYPNINAVHCLSWVIPT